MLISILTKRQGGCPVKLLRQSSVGGGKSCNVVRTDQNILQHKEKTS
jgi:hypothetical protein